MKNTKAAILRRNLRDEFLHNETGERGGGHLSVKQADDVLRVSRQKKSELAALTAQHPDSDFKIQNGQIVRIY